MKTKQNKRFFKTTKANSLEQTIVDIGNVIKVGVYEATV